MNNFVRKKGQKKRRLFFSFSQFALDTLPVMEVIFMDEKIAKKVIEIQDIIEFLDDGQHYEDVEYLIKVRDEMVSKLTPWNRIKCDEYLRSRTKKIFKVL